MLNCFTTSEMYHHLTLCNAKLVYLTEDAVVVFFSFRKQPVYAMERQKMAT